MAWPNDNNPLAQSWGSTGNNSSFGSMGNWGMSGGNQGMDWGDTLGYGGTGLQDLGSASMFGDMGFGNQNGLSQGFDWGKLMDNMGGVSGIMGGIGSLAQAWAGMKQLGLSEDMLKENKNQFNLNYNAQAGLANSQLARRHDKDVQEAAYYDKNLPSTEEYLASYGVDTSKTNKTKKTA